MWFMLSPGKCTDKWPTGWVYKDEENCEVSKWAYRGKDATRGSWPYY